ncbi:MAG: hypothetical protein CMB58_003215 [Methanobacteriota archaeon]|nr:MAG: hypothetical protein CMB58_003215 [Euryarchaeota archaeon]|tara:strand:+ start:494 stop:898 length:405 start_codon:yes stop_codon:yes gene_type:complete
MRWDSPPVWPVAVPSVTGFAASFIPYLSESSYFSEGSILAPFALVASLFLLLLLLPAEKGGGAETIIGAWAAMLFALLPQMLFFVWFVPVVLIWFHQSVFVWRRSYPLFRIGIWLGLGASSGIYLGSILAFNSF